MASAIVSDRKRQRNSKKRKRCFPEGANLDRVQIIKGWRDPGGEFHERIFDVAVSGDREIDADGRCREDVGSSVEVALATWKNEIGGRGSLARVAGVDCPGVSPDSFPG